MRTQGKGKRYWRKKLPPSNILAEEIIIGYLVSDISTRNYILDNTASNFFTLQKHKILRHYMLKNNHREHNMAETISNLWTQNLLMRIGGVSYILHAIHRSKAISIHNNKNACIIYFITILSNNYIKRLFIQYSHTILQLGYFNKIAPEQIKIKAGKYLNTLSNSIARKGNYQNNIGYFLQEVNRRPSRANKISSGFRDLDNITNGFKEGELIILAGRPSMGKTSLAINIAYYAIIDLNIKAHVFSLEMSRNEILDRFIALTSSISLDRVQKKIVVNHEWTEIQKACEILVRSKLCIDDNEYSSIEYIKKQCLNYTTKEVIIIIDYLQLIRSIHNFTENRSQEISSITRELKLLARNIKAPIILLSQLNRNIENRTSKKPLLSDLRESGCLSYLNMPYIQHHYAYLLTQAIFCFTEFYKLSNSESELKNSSKQYIYSVSNQKKYSYVNATHNHKIFTNKGWSKKDNIKKKNLQKIKIRNKLKIKILIEVRLIKKIKLLKKEETYDVTIDENSNFLTNENIVHNSIEQDADLILMLYQKNEDNSSNKIDITVAKHRNGSTGSFQLLFHADTCKFKSVEKQISIDIYD